MLENENMIDLLGSLKGMSSEQLSRLIQEETAKEDPSDEIVLTALDILEAREKENPIELGPKGKDAWKKYQSKVRSRNRKTVLIWKPLMQVASVLLVITLLFALLPTQANAETWWERLARWTDDFFSFFNPNAAMVPEYEYTFQTNNEGLQQVYDAVVGIGVNEPVVPMWIPEEYLLINLIIDELPDQDIVVALFNDGANDMILQICRLQTEVTHRYYKDKEEANSIEIFGTVFNILDNSKKKMVIWAIDNIECSLSIDCQDKILNKVIESIYRWRPS